MLTLFQINTKGAAVPKVGGAQTEAEAVAYALRIIVRAKGMDAKNGAKYLRTLGVSRNQAIFFESFKSSRLQALGTIRLGQFVDNYEVSTLYAHSPRTETLFFVVGGVVFWRVPSEILPFSFRVP